ncbi:hypothetical protein SAMN05216605_117141 [Pseudomonas abietaniphila]|uniref:Uncharacterized protein n=1 Tax=Pseudomonas abietaniphila TaxID=89065 RepID=A0A1G8NP09_9PSED|nr:hypothetical protein SAMN05216605_117141 [Pseudomonas abietaniphila]
MPAMALCQLHRGWLTNSYRGQARSYGSRW